MHRPKAAPAPSSLQSVKMRRSRQWTKIEMLSLCAPSSDLAFDLRVEFVQVKRDHFLEAARTIRKRITPDVLRALEAWRDQAGVKES